MTDNKSSWGRKMYLISPMQMEALKRKEMKDPYYINKNLSDYKNQLNDEKIVSDKIQTKLDFEKKREKFQIF